MKQKKLNILITILILILNLNIIFGQEASPDTIDSGYGLYPVIFYTDQTSLAFGGHGVYFFKNIEAAHQSTVSADIIYTLKDQLIIGGETEIYYIKHRISGAVWYDKFPDVFYGIGNNTREEDAEDFMNISYEAKGNFQYNLFSQFYAGVLFHIQHHHLAEVESGGELAQQELQGTGNPFWMTGAGLLVNWDNRDHVYYPTSGSFFRFSATSFNKNLGGEYECMKYIIDLGQYLAITKKTVLAFQGYLGFVTGNAPVQSYQALGDETFRGFSARYRDRAMFTFQTELRMKLWDRFGLAIFAGLGDVSAKLQSFRLKEFKFGAGIGFRFVIIPETGLNVRLDFGFGSGGNSSLTFYPGEAF